MKLSEFLKESFALIDTESKWVQGMSAADSHGIAISLTSRNACKFCSSGAMARIMHDTRRAGSKLKLGIYTEAMDLLLGITGHTSLSLFNDRNKYRVVSKAWKKAIEIAEKEERNDLG